MRRWRFLLVAMALLGVSAVASAQQVFWDDFEAYADGSDLHGQAGWKGWDNVAGATGKISTQYAFSGKKSVEIMGATDQVHEWKLTGGRYVFTIQQYIPSGTTGISDFILMSKYVDGGAGNEWAVQTQYTLDSGAITTWHRGIPPVKIVYDQWVEIKLYIDLVNNTVDEYYGGELIAHDTWSASNSGTFSAIDLYGNGAASVYYDDIKIERYYVYEASTPTPVDGATGVVDAFFKWVGGDDAVFHNIYLGTSPDLTAADQIGTNLTSAMQYYQPGLQPGVKYFWRVDETEMDGTTVHEGHVWSFTSAPLTAYAPYPWDGVKGVDPQTAQLTWINNVTAQSCDVYFGTSKDDVANGTGDTFKVNQYGADYTPGVLAENTMYFWRVDQVESDGTKRTGPVWSFTTLGPEDGVTARYFVGITADGQPVLTQVELGIDHSWGEGEVAAKMSDNVSARWTGILEAPFTETCTLITTTDDGVRLWLDGRRIINNWTDHTSTDNPAQVDLIAGQPYLVMMEWYEKTGGATARLSWESPSIARDTIPAGVLQLPLRATSPYPLQAGVAPQDVTLHWTAGEKAARHELYFGDDPEAVANSTTPTARLDLDENRFTPDTLEWNKTYYWKVHEVNDASTWKGAVWSFTTAGFIVVDDFDSYNDEEEKGTRIYETWIDGWTNGTGSLVGYTEQPFAEQVLVQSGKQSMPIDYNNVNSPYYSEVQREYSVAQDWTTNGMDTLALYVRGMTPNRIGQALYVTLEDQAGMTGTVVHPDPAILKSVSWAEWQIPLSEFGVNAAAIKEIVIGVGNKDTPAPGTAGKIFVDNIRVIQAAQ